MNMRVLALTALMVLPFPAEAQKSSTSSPRPTAEPIEEVPQPRKMPPLVQGRISVGDPAPGFVLDNSSGAPIRLSQLRGDWLLLVFADRGHQLATMRPVEADMKSIGVRIVGVCREKLGRLKRLSSRDSLDFLMLGDVTGQVSAVYGLYDRDRSEIQPGFVVIDRRGIVRSAVLGQQLPADQIAQIARLKVTGLP